MRIFVFSREYQVDFRNEIQTILDFVKKSKGQILFSESIRKDVTAAFALPENTCFLAQEESLNDKADLVVSLGGDGTLLETVGLIKDSNIPVMGVNFGRLGFLSNTPKDEFRNSLEAFGKGNFSLSKRTVLEVDQCIGLFGRPVYALNEVVIHKKMVSAMISVDAYVNEEHLNHYWSDGIIVATPTGSTAYSLSCGGPILVPEAENLILTPIAPHNLTVRPIVISDNDVVTLIPEGRTGSFILSLDSNQAEISRGQKIVIRKAGFTINFVRQVGDTFYKILREKLMWGEDKRNI